MTTEPKPQNGTQNGRMIFTAKSLVPVGVALAIISVAVTLTWNFNTRLLGMEFGIAEARQDVRRGDRKLDARFSELNRKLDKGLRSINEKFDNRLSNQWTRADTIALMELLAAKNPEIDVPIPGGR